MGKVGIITLNGYFNYGNRLQNYALEQVLRNLGYEVETIIVDLISNINSNRQKKFIEKIKEKNIKEVYFATQNKIQEYVYKNKLKQQRTIIFKDFSKRFISETKISISDQDIPKVLKDRYDFFVTGSDQVWNPYYTGGSSLQFLTFAPINKRISYAASFGISEIPNQYINNYKRWLSEMEYLSVREETGAKIIKKLTGKDAKVHVDPTMLLTKEEWLSISEVPSHKPKKPYLLTYFLGDIPNKRKNKLKEIARKNDLEIVHLAQIKDRKPYLSGPSEFIDYINSASVFCTDSFHGAVFSILLNRPFIVFDREGKTPSMNSRIDTLLNKFKLESRKIENIKFNSQVFEIDYSHIPPILEVERNKSLDYLKKALNID